MLVSVRGRDRLAMYHLCFTALRPSPPHPQPSAPSFTLAYCTYRDILASVCLCLCFCVAEARCTWVREAKVVLEHRMISLDMQVDTCQLVNFFFLSFGVFNCHHTTLLALYRPADRHTHRHTYTHTQLQPWVARRRRERRRGRSQPRHRYTHTHKRAQQQRATLLVTPMQSLTLLCCTTPLLRFNYHHLTGAS